MSWNGNGPEGLHGRCKRSCCWTPYQHNPARDNLPEWRRCKCHDVESPVREDGDDE